MRRMGIIIGVLALGLAGCASSLGDGAPSPAEALERGAVGGSPLTTLRATTGKSIGIATTLSADRRVLYQAHGTKLTAYNADLLRRMAFGAPDRERAVIAEADVFATPMALHEVGDVLFIAAGDSGLMTAPADLSRGPSVAVPGEDVDLWCMDVVQARYAGQTLVLALWSGRGVHEISVHDADGTLLDTFVLPSSSFDREATSWAMAEAGGFVYLAAGTSGIVRMDWHLAMATGTVVAEQGPLAIDRSVERREAELMLSRDLSIAGNQLYVAGNALGVVTVDLDDPWEPTMPTVSTHDGVVDVRSYPTRVEAITRKNGEHAVIAGVAPRPTPWFEWGPYFPYSTFDWETNARAVPEIVLNGGGKTFDRGVGSGVSVYEASTVSGELELRATERLTGHGTGYNDLVALEERGEIWAFTEQPILWRYNATAVETLRHSAPGAFIEGAGGYSSGAPSKLLPDVLIAGVDGQERLPMITLESEDSLGELPVPQGGDHFTGLWVSDSWITKDGTEMFVVGGAGEHWGLRELRDEPDGVWIDQWRIPVGFTAGATNGRDRFGYDPRSYSSSSVDEASHWIALARSESRGGVVLTTRAALELAAKQAPSFPSQSAVTHDVVPRRMESLVLHEEAPVDGSGWPTTEHLFAFESHFFDSAAGGRVLGVSAGYYVDPTSPDYQRPKVVFYDLDGADRGTIQRAVAIGSEAPGMAVDFHTFAAAGKQWMVVGSTGGRVTLHDLSQLPQVFAGTATEDVLRPVATWDVGPEPLDGYRDFITDVHVRQETEDGDPRLVVYVAANRGGVYRLDVMDLNGHPRLVDSVESRLNTPFQAVSLSMVEVDGPPMMVVYDHGGGIHTFGE